MPRMHSQLISFARSNNEKVITCQECQSAMVVYGQTITANVSHQNWCKVSLQKPWSCVVRQSPQKFHTRTGQVQSFTAKAMIVCGQTISANVSHRNWCKISRQKPWSYVLRQSLSWSALVVCHSEHFSKKYVKGLSTSGQI